MSSTKKGFTAAYAVHEFAFAPGTRLDEIATDDHPGFDGGKAEGHAALAAEADELADLQARLWAAGATGDERRILLVLQGMDTAGKGGIVKHVVSAVQPMGIEYTAFKAPSAAERRHDFLWRIRNALPAAGKIGVFDRSHYEDVLIGRVRELAPAEEIEARYRQINDFEAELTAAGTTVVKVMLHLSYEEQRDRLSQRLHHPDKYWKFNPGDIDERRFWPAYTEAYQIALEKTATPDAPWYVIPADHKWFARLAVQRLLLDALRSFELGWPPADYDVEEQRERLART